MTLEEILEKRKEKEMKKKEIKRKLRKIKKAIRNNKNKILYGAEIAMLLGTLGSCASLYGNYVDGGKEEPKVTIESENNIDDNIEEKENKDFIIYNDQIVTMKDNKLDNDLTSFRTFGTPFMLKVEPTGYTYGEIYKTIDEVKKVIENGYVGLPILYDIEKLMDKDTIRANCLLAEEFVNKLMANGCYVGLYGSEESMERFEEKFKEVTETNSIDLYDKLIVYENDKVEYDGVFNMSQKKDENVTCDFNMEKVINENKLNNFSKFVNDSKYIVKENDTLEEIASSVGMKTMDLAYYNGISDYNKITVGQEIIIPNHYQNQDIKVNKESKNIDNESMPSETTTRMVKGIDVSKWQSDVDWEKVSKEIDFAIVRLCDFYFKKDDGTCEFDPYFIRNMQECERLNIPVGVYYFSHATTEEEAREEARFVANNLKEYSLEYPVYMDIETEKQNKLMEDNPEQLKNVASAAMEELEKNGYFSGIYCGNGSEREVNRRQFIDELSKKYTFWVTSGSTYNKSVDFEEFKDDTYEVKHLPDTNIPIYQYSQQGSIDGINAKVDLDYGIMSLEDVIESNGYSKVKSQ